MTTIAYKKGELAADSRIVVGDTIITDGHRKVHRLRDGRLVAWAGSVEDAERLVTALRKGHPMPRLDCISALLVSPDGTVELYEGNVWIKQGKQPHYAVGSGSPYALAAMDAGVGAKRAVQIAIKRDTSSGGRVQTLKLKRKK